jgi:predicted nucleic acid-binding protein
MMRMPDNIFIDTNIIIYALGPASVKANTIAHLFVNSPFISIQVLSETANVAAKRLMMPSHEIRKLISTLETICRIEVVTLSALHTALDIKERYHFSWYDSLIIATALEAGCDILYTEDLQNHQIIEGQLRIINPFV